MKNILTLLISILILFSLRPVHAAGILSDEDQRRIHDDLVHASENMHAWINNVKEGFRDDIKGISGDKPIGQFRVEPPRDPMVQKDFFADAPKKELEIFDIESDKDIPGIVYLFTSPDRSPHIAVYFQDVTTDHTITQRFKDLLQTNPSFELVAEQTIRDVDSGTSDGDGIVTTQVMARDLRLKRTSDVAGLPLKDFLCPLQEPGIIKKAMATLANKDTDKPQHSDCL